MAGRELLAAAKSADAEALEQLLQTESVRTAVGSSDQWGNTALHYAASAGLDSGMRQLLVAQADPNAVSTDGLTALHLAAHRGENLAVALLVEEGASLELRDKHGRSALDLALEADMMPVARLLEATAARTQDQPHDQGLTIRAQGGAEADPEAEPGEQVLACLAEMPAADPQEIDPANRNGVKLLQACANGDFQAVASVMSQPTQELPDLANLVTRSGRTAMHVAVAEGHLDILRYLVVHGGSIHSITRRSKRTCLHIAAEVARANVTATLLNEYGMSPATTDADGMSALHVAVLADATDVVRHLLYDQPGSLMQLKALLKVCDNNGVSAVDVAGRVGHYELHRELRRCEQVCSLAIEPEAAVADYIEAVLAMPCRNQLIQMFASITAGQAASERNLMVSRLFLTGVQVHRRQNELPKLPLIDPDSDITDLVDLALWLMSRRQLSVSSGSTALSLDHLPSKEAFDDSFVKLGTPRVPQEIAIDTLLVASLVDAAAAVAEQCEYAGVVIDGFGDSRSMTERDAAKHRVITQVQKGELSNDEGGVLIGNMAEFARLTDILDEMGEEPKPKPKKTSFMEDVSQSWKSLVRLVDAAVGNESGAEEDEGRQELAYDAARDSYKAPTLSSSAESQDVQSIHFSEGKSSASGNSSNPYENAIELSQPEAACEDAAKDAEQLERLVSRSADKRILDGKNNSPESEPEYEERHVCVRNEPGNDQSKADQLDSSLDALTEDASVNVVADHTLVSPIQPSQVPPSPLPTTAKEAPADSAVKIFGDLSDNVESSTKQETPDLTNFGYTGENQEPTTPPVDPEWARVQAVLNGMPDVGHVAQNQSGQDDETICEGGATGTISSCSDSTTTKNGETEDYRSQLFDSNVWATDTFTVDDGADPLDVWAAEAKARKTLAKRRSRSGKHTQKAIAVIADAEAPPTGWTDQSLFEAPSQAVAVPQSPIASPKNTLAVLSTFGKAAIHKFQKVQSSVSQRGDGTAPAISQVRDSVEPGRMAMADSKGLYSHTIAPEDAIAEKAVTESTFVAQKVQGDFIPPAVDGVDGTPRSNTMGNDESKTRYPTEAVSTPPAQDTLLLTANLFPVGIMCPSDETHGIELLPENGDHTVKVVAAGSPADLAGVRPGDTIELIEGQLARSLSLADVAALMRAARAESRVLQLQLARQPPAKGELFGAIFSRSSTRDLDHVSIPKSRSADGLGFTMTMSQTTGEVIVTHVQPGGAADVAGLRNGDVIEASAGRTLKTMGSLLDVIKFIKRVKKEGTVTLAVSRGRASAIKKSLAFKVTKLKKAVQKKITDAGSKERDPLAGAPAWWKDSKSTGSLP